MRRTEVSEEVRRLIRVLMRWTRSPMSTVAENAGVSKGNLSRLMREDAATPGVGAAKAAAVLAELQWTSRGPRQGVVHRWVLDATADLQWMFETVLSGELVVHPLLTDEESVSLLDHQGVLLGTLRNAWFVLTYEPMSDGDPLAELLHPHKRLAKRGTPYVIRDPGTYKLLASGSVAVRDLPALLSGEEPAPSVEVSIAKTMSPHLARWLIQGHLEKLLHDGYIRFVRCHREEAVDLFMDELIRDFAERNSSQPDRAGVAALRRVAERMADEVAGEAYDLAWGPSPKREAGSG